MTDSNDDFADIDFQYDVKIEDRQDLKNKITELEEQIVSLNKRVTTLSKENDKLSAKLDKTTKQPKTDKIVEKIVEVQVEVKTLDLSRNYVSLNGIEYKILDFKTLKELEIDYKRRYVSEGQWVVVIDRQS